MENPKIEQTCANTVSGRQADGIIICSEHLPFNIDESGPHSFANFPPIVSAAGIAASKNSINTESQCTIDLIESTQPTKLSN